MRRSTLALLLFLPALLFPRAHADEVVLNGGTRIEGIVLEESEAGVRLLLPPRAEIRLLAADVKEVRTDPSAPAAGGHLGFREPGEEPGGLQVAVTYLVPKEGGPRVTLVGAVHIADPEYYREVQRILDAADLVLFEGIIPEGMTPRDFEEKKAERENPVRELQEKLAGWFGLEFQLSAIDYDRPHFVHADFTMEEFAAASGVTIAPDGEGAPALPKELEGPLKQFKTFLPLLEAQLSKPGPARDGTKAMIARLMGSGQAEQMLGVALPGLTDLILTKRNARLIERLREHAGKDVKNIAVFYGAAHMRGIEELLVEKEGYRRAGARWLLAWRIPPVK
jgi:hypothetical protein